MYEILLGKGARVPDMLREKGVHGTIKVEKQILAVLS
jgi:hypothetical protein